MNFSLLYVTSHAGKCPYYAGWETSSRRDEEASFKSQQKLHEGSYVNQRGTASHKNTYTKK